MTDQPLTPHQTFLRQALQDSWQLLLLPPIAKPLLQHLHKELLQLQQHLDVLSAEAEQVMARHGQQRRRPAGNCDSSSSIRRQSADDAGIEPQQGIAAASDLEQEGSSTEDGSDDALGSVLQDLVPFDAFDPSLPGADVALEDEEALLEDDGMLEEADEAAICDDDGCFIAEEEDDDDAWLAAAAAAEEEDDSETGGAVDAGVDSSRLLDMPQLRAVQRF